MPMNAKAEEKAVTVGELKEIVELVDYLKRSFDGGTTSKYEVYRGERLLIMAKYLRGEIDRAEFQKLASEIHNGMKQFMREHFDAGATSQSAFLEVFEFILQDRSIY